MYVGKPRGEYERVWSWCDWVGQVRGECMSREGRHVAQGGQAWLNASKEE